MLALKILGIVLLSLLGLILLYGLFLWIASLFVPRRKMYTKFSPFYYALLQSASSLVLFVTRIKVEKVNFDKIPKDGRFLLIMNHTSNFESILTWSIFRKRQFIFVSKEENFDLPIFGKFLSKSCFQAIDRSDPKQSLRVLNQVTEFLKNDQNCVGIFPEGTRNQGTELLPFHDGVLRPAIKAQVPIIVMTVRGAKHVKDNFPLHGTTVSFHVVDVIYPEEMKGESTHTLSARARAKMEADLYGPDGKMES